MAAARVAAVIAVVVVAAACRYERWETSGWGCGREQEEMVGGWLEEEGVGVGGGEVGAFQRL